MGSLVGLCVDHAAQVDGQWCLPVFTMATRLDHFSDWTHVVKRIAMLQAILTRNKAGKKTDVDCLSICEENKEKAILTVLKIAQHKSMAREPRLYSREQRKEKSSHGSHLLRLNGPIPRR